VPTNLLSECAIPKLNNSKTQSFGTENFMAPLDLKETPKGDLTSLHSRPRVHSFVWDVAVTTAASGLMLVQGVLSVSLVGRWLGALAVGEYLLVSRVASWLGSGMQLGIGVALPRYVARGTAQHSSGLSYLTSALLCLLSVALAIGALLLLARQVFAKWLFGRSEMAYLVLPLVLVLLGQVIQTAVYGYYRGHLWMQWANSLQVVNMVLVPIGAILLLYRHGSVASILTLNGAASAASAFLFLIPAVRLFRPADLRDIRPHLSELLQYGVARVPGEFAGNALIALGPVIASHYLPISEVSGLLLGIGMLMAVSASVAPCGTVLLSKISMMLARNQVQAVQLQLQHFIAGVLELSVFVCLQVIVFADVIVQAWVGSGYLKGVGVIRITLLSIPFWLFFVALRSAIDAATVVAHNAHNGYIALAVFLGLTGAAVAFVPRAYLLDAIAGALMGAFAVLAWRTAGVAQELLGVKVPWRQCAAPLALGTALGIGSYAIHHAARDLALPAIMLLEVAISVMFVLFLPRLGSTWLRESWKLFVVRKVQTKTEELLRP
jgi:O-antigen/teichoic acid export membrane protein